MRDIEDLNRFVDQHLTAAALMVPMAEPLPATMRALEARRRLKEADFDLSLVEDERLRIVTMRRLASLSREQLARPVLELAESPQRGRLIEQTLPIRRVAGKLLASREPLLVVGESGITHLITAADFAGVAGTAVVLSFLLAVDRALNELLRTQADAAMNAVTEKQRAEAEERRQQAEAERAALETLDYLSMGARFAALRKLGLHRRYDLGDAGDHRLLLNVRNEAAHRGLSDPDAALRAVAVAEWTLERLIETVSSSEESESR